MKSVFATALFCIFSINPACAEVAKTAAEIFRTACLNGSVLRLGSGSSVDQGLAAAAETNRLFKRMASKAKKAGLVGRPRYSLAADRTSGRFFCHVSSKALTADEIVPYFASLAGELRQSFGEPKYGEAAIDGKPHAKVDGLRSTFRNRGLQVIFEAIYFVSDRGPVGGFAISVEHDTK